MTKYVVIGRSKFYSGCFFRGWLVGWWCVVGLVVVGGGVCVVCGTDFLRQPRKDAKDFEKRVNT